MEFAKVNVDVRSAAKKGGARKVRSGGQFPACSTAASASRSP
jgi:ribosomal protein L25 (general stress protein Ctc)